MVAKAVIRRKDELESRGFAVIMLDHETIFTFRCIEFDGYTSILNAIIIGGTIIGHPMELSYLPDSKIISILRDHDLFGIELEHWKVIYESIVERTGYNLITSRYQGRMHRIRAGLESSNQIWEHVVGCSIYARQRRQVMASQTGCAWLPYPL